MKVRFNYFSGNSSLREKIFHVYVQEKRLYVQGKNERELNCRVFAPTYPLRKGTAGCICSTCRVLIVIWNFPE